MKHHIKLWRERTGWGCDLGWGEIAGKKKLDEKEGRMERTAELAEREGVSSSPKRVGGEGER